MSLPCAALLAFYTPAVEEACSHFAAGAAPGSREPLLRWSAGMVLLSRLQGERRREQGFRQVVRALSKRAEVDPEAVVRRLLRNWYESAGTLSRARLRETLLEPERQRLEAALPGGGGGPGDPTGFLLSNPADPRVSRERFCRHWRRELEQTVPLLGGDGAGIEDWRVVLHRASRDLSALHAALRLHCLSTDVLLHRLVRQALVSLLLHLRHLPADWPVGSRRYLLALVILIIELLEPGRESAATTARCHAVLRQNGRLLARWRQSAVEPGSALRRLAWPEIHRDLGAVARSVRGGDGAGAVDLAIPLARCHRTLYLVGEPALSWWADGLQQGILARRQLGQPVDRRWRASLRSFREAVMSGTKRMPLIAGLLELLALESRETLTAICVPAVGWRDPGPDPGVAEPDQRQSGTAISQLSAGLDCLADPRRVQTAWEAGRIPEIVQELTMLERGAAVLGVRRVQTVAAVLLALYRRAAAPGFAATPDPALGPVLRRGHAGLLYRLDQAAAWQPVSRPQSLVEYLHRHLETGPVPAQRLTPQRRCLDINRRIQTLLAGEDGARGEVLAPALVDTEGQQTVVRSLLRDQARLLAVLCRDGEGRR